MLRQPLLLPPCRTELPCTTPRPAAAWTSVPSCWTRAAMRHSGTSAARRRSTTPERRGSTTSSLSSPATALPSPTLPERLGECHAPSCGCREVNYLLYMYMHIYHNLCYRYTTFTGDFGSRVWQYCQREICHNIYISWPKLNCRLYINVVAMGKRKGCCYMQHVYYTNCKLLVP